MKTPPLLIGAALLFWGWQTNLLIPATIMAVILESARFIKARWELSNEDFSRIWTFCTLLFLATAVYGFTAGSGPARLGEWMSSGSFSAGNAASSVTTKTTVLLIRWMPIKLITRLSARERAKASLVLRVRLDGNPDGILKGLTKATGASILSRPSAGNVAGECAILCPRNTLMEAIEYLRKHGGDEAITAQDADYVFVKDDPLIAAFESAVKS